MGMDHLPDDAYERTMEAKAPPCRNCIELLHGEVYFADRVVQDLKLLQQHMEHFGFSQLLVGTINRMLDYSQYHLDVHKELSEKAKAQRAKNDGERAEDLGAGRLGEDGEVHGGNGL